ncbi:DUF5684 domain-containing protein [Mucilaginibacter sp. L3T2-6]|uniref:DUF5684 domain-containing protein n=1 Tax=Mucilaginibacter sp. L3T2-6 TaxID=3062491 RepID=UPI00267518BF|nr:DUF5684 domain-containing protein [Mucilaginibacter sp. L3T2-6]MDO3640801.1 DUF5684 domain-containing protein [Mucilaginibacter sp. L3T2-6]MDV6212858.1 DUF5684 domain-containing protein [Mucilaginibacter sp. L3T2-6]
MQDYNSDSSSVDSFGAFMAIILAMLIPIIIVSVITIIGQWKVYSKAGKPGWACIIPIYNIIVMLEIVGKPLWWVILFFIPCVNIIFVIWTLNLVSKSFGQSEGFTIGLLLLGFIFWPILGFGNYPYLGPSAAEARNMNNPVNPFPPSNYQDPFSNNNPPPQS